MKKLFTLAMIAGMALAATSVSAQEKNFKKFQLGIGVETGLPIGQFGKVYTLGAGATVRAAVGVNKDLAITATSGAIAFIPKTVKGVDMKAQLNIPIKAGVKYMVAKKLYTLGEAGVTISRVYFPTPAGLQSASASSFTYAANIGTHLGKFDASLRYEGYKGSGFVGIRLGFNF